MCSKNIYVGIFIYCTRHLIKLKSRLVKNSKIVDRYFLETHEKLIYASI